jgi:hypothetical protein
MNPRITCPHCRTRLLDGAFNRQKLVPCPSCRTLLEIEVFPALFRGVQPGESAEPVMVEGESSCFFHPQKKAVIPCASCGRFLCALCDCPLGGEHVCPTCLETGKSKGRIKVLDNRRTRYDALALTLAVLPFLITAPVALFIAVRYWNKPGSLVQPGHGRFLLAILLALLQLAGWAFVWFMA